MMTENDIIQSIINYDLHKEFLYIDIVKDKGIVEIYLEKPKWYQFEYKRRLKLFKKEIHNELIAGIYYVIVYGEKL